MYTAEVEALRAELVGAREVQGEYENYDERKNVMQIQVNTDNHIVGNAELSRQVEGVIESALGRFADRVTRVEVHLTDESSSQKDVGNDKRCVIETRLAGLQPLKVGADGPSIEQALADAAEKAEKTITRTLERLEDPKGRTSFAGEGT